MKFFENVSDSFAGSYAHFKKLTNDTKRPAELLKKLVVKIWPQMPGELISTYDAFLEHQKYQKQRKKSILRTFIREMRDLKQKAKNLIYENIENKIIAAERRFEHEEQNERVQLLKKQLKSQKIKKDKITKEIEKKQRLEEQKQQRLLILKQKEFEHRAAKLRDATMRYKRQKLAEERKKQKKKENEKFTKKKILKEKIESNRPRVEMRQEIAEKQVIQQKEEQQLREQLLQNRKEMIKEVIEKYSFRPQVGPDWRRIRADTESEAVRKKTKEVKPLFKKLGYEDKVLMGDMRFKLSTALYEAGLYNTEYARGVLNKGVSKTIAPF